MKDYKIYQIKNDASYEFASYNFAMAHGFTMDDYEIVYSGKVEMNPDKYITLDNLFTLFNTNRPDDFKGHSLSVSDIVEIDGIRYYCNTFNWIIINGIDLI